MTGDQAPTRAQAYSAVLSMSLCVAMLIASEFMPASLLTPIAEGLGAEIHEKKPLLPLDFFQKNCGLLVKLSLQHEGIAPAG